ncbi:MAG TPA: rhomboid family intramembrane serine protease [Chitinophaga sp.]|uniref:rhomboid family intramembrane serine protease n=1 Tax=Chitinophaga sp. TaxID=1869181 RepID=UPI002C3F242F|nr:rhomboid family intramembrane serine protease [Chitinophaga sp.]HVI43783.1 rhomboid family intramembrane serine protease [Chitinophaga sp.]
MSTSIIIIIITSLISYTALNNYDQLDKLSMQPYMVSRHNQYYRFITSGFVHGDMQHLLFNMLTLLFFGEYVENVFQFLFGSKLVFPLYYILGIIVADIPSFLRHRNNQYYSSIGASGAISAVLFTFIMVEPWTTIRIFFVLPVPAIIYGVLFLAISAYMSRKGGSNVDHSAHLWGAIFGIVFPLVFHPEIGTFFIGKLLHRF